MLPTLGYAAGLYLCLACALLAAWGAGSRGLRCIGADRPDEAGGPATAVVVGTGLYICLFQVLAIAGWFRAAPVLLSLGVGLLVGAHEAWRSRRRQAPPARLAWTLGEGAAFCLMLAVALPTFIRPLGVPLVWDELMYHLPHARLWAQEGTLAIHEWLRYPRFPYNVDLLFAACLLLGSDVATHLVSASAGWLAACIIYRLGVRYLDRITACIATAFWFVLTISEYNRAYVDMPVALFTVAALAGFLRWQELRACQEQAARGWLAASAFCMGIAVGSKYQALMVLPLFAVSLVRHDRRPSTWAWVLSALLLPAGYWYARNAWQTGDPFSPIGGRIFGFHDWNAEDLRLQFEDLRRHAAWPEPWLVAAVWVPFFPALRQRAGVRAAIVAAAYLVATWAVSSRYPRYLMVAYPLLSLLAAAGWMEALRLIARRVSRSRRPPRGLPGRPAIALVLVTIVAVVLAAATKTQLFQRIASTHDEREAVLTARVTGYPVLAWLREHPSGKVYQMGLEETLYYAPARTHGDGFGPWRYRDYIGLEPQALHQALRRQDFDALLIHTGRMPNVTSKPGFDRWFHLMFAHEGVALYRLDTAPAP
ncbi:ArnT family glycosyltransferase [Xylophilus sp. GOD-11R]|uniref:ArnT family glycosyltransferase n=1 Tax=Xylophilus sp. GOD-11R TaxID=3089814 RepID=UPI00298C48E2|nr:glycosyltransferase family 39 protein [Xylophilus sp. GOD-11R]WPB56347.1 phospholipid carrier-dependent glycosyltransferase [Xylophilus sp. GOD-11R]